MTFSTYLHPHIITIMKVMWFIICIIINNLMFLQMQVSMYLLEHQEVPFPIMDLSLV